MSTRALRHVWKKLRPINTWYFFVVFVIFLIIGVAAVRQNNLTSIQLRDEVLKADEQNGDVEAALQKLRTHMHSHMNAGLSSGGLQQPIQLKYRYERLAEEQRQKLAADNEDIYTEAQAYCEGQGGGLREARVPCVQDYVSQRLGNQAIPQVPDALYKFDFYSPAWTLDLAGVSLLLAGLFLALFVIRYLTERWFRAELRDSL
jgi:hypothetical protein